MSTSSRKTPAPWPDGRVLIVDDDEAHRESLAEVLETKFGCTVTGVENGKRALDLLARGGAAPSLILLDLMMPVMNGWEFLEHRHKDPALAAIPVVVISAALDAKAQLPHVSGYVKKPVTDAQLLGMVQRIREGAAASEPEPRESPPRRGGAGPERILLIQESTAEAERTAALLRDAKDFSFELRHHGSLADLPARELLASVDVVLFDVASGAPRGLDALAKTVRRASGVPVVALLGDTEPASRTEVLRRGAVDALAKPAQSPELLGRMLHNAIELAVLRAELEKANELAAHEREHRRLSQLAQPRAPVAAETLGHRPLKAASPGAFGKFVKDFVGICDKAVAEREHELEAATQRGQLQRFSAALAALRVGPGDVVDIYQAALSSAWSDDAAELAAAKRDEARLMLIGVLGHVMASYRLYVGAEKRPEPVT